MLIQNTRQYIGKKQIGFDWEWSMRELDKITAEMDALLANRKSGMFGPKSKMFN